MKELVAPLKSFRVALILSAVSALMLAGCVMLPAAEDSSSGSMAEEKTEEKPHWGYEGKAGPESWGGLSPDFALCGTGAEQSPIDVTGPEDADLSDIVFNYSPSDLSIINNGHSVQVNYDAGSSIELDGEAFNLLQFHMHSLSEHTLNGEHFPVEIHLVHQAESGQLAVVGIFVEEGEANEALSGVWSNMPAEESEAMAIDGTSVNAADFLPADQSSFRYMGSLTTPPCSEQVRWHILTEPITLSADQIATFTSIFDSNFRPVQPLNARTIVVDQANN